MTKEQIEKESLNYAQKNFYPAHYSLEKERRAFEAGAKMVQKELQEAKEIIKNLRKDIFHLMKHYPSLRGHKEIFEDVRKAEDFLNGK